METKQAQPKRFQSTPVSRITLPGFQVTNGTIAPVQTATHTCRTTARKLSIAAAIVAPQGHAISVALRTLVARRALVASL